MARSCPAVGGSRGPLTPAPPTPAARGRGSMRKLTRKRVRSGSGNDDEVVVLGKGTGKKTARHEWADE